MLTLLKLFNEIEREAIFPNSFLGENITVIPKPEKDPTKKRELQANLPNEYR